MPGTPTFSKAVHFDAHLEHVRHFLQLDRPLAVSAGSSPVENFDSDSEYPFPSSEDENPQTRSPRFEWEIQAPNFPRDDVARRSLPVRVERFWLSKDCRSLQGSVAVANLAFHKNIICRFTLDGWKTTSEVTASHTGQIQGSNHERWTFTIRLSDMAHLETKTMYLCVRYNVNGQEYWDNNGGSNFKVSFQKKYLPQNGKRGYTGAGSRPAGELPRSSTRRPNNDPAVRPKSMPACLIGDPFIARRTKLNSAPVYDDENDPIRLKRHTPNSRSEDFTSATASRNQAFGRRYDFNASLHEAKQFAKAGDSRQHTNVNVNKPAKPKPSFLHANGNDSPSRKNYTYDEIVNRFCFYGSKQSSTHQAQSESSGPPKVDGHDDALGSMSDAHDRYQHRAGAVARNPSSTTTAPGSDYADRPSSPSIRPASPASNFSPRVGTSPVSVATHHSQRHNRFPFRPEAHAPTAIHG
jgi:hypothetical protein